MIKNTLLVYGYFVYFVYCFDQVCAREEAAGLRISSSNVGHRPAQPAHVHSCSQSSAPKTVSTSNELVENL